MTTKMDREATEVGRSRWTGESRRPSCGRRKQERWSRTNGGRNGSALRPAWPSHGPVPAFYGLAGEIVEAIEPQSEADPAALLVTLLAAFGAVVGPGRTPWRKLPNTRRGSGR